MMKKIKSVSVQAIVVMPNKGIEKTIASKANEEKMKDFCVNINARIPEIPMIKLKSSALREFASSNGSVLKILPNNESIKG